MTFLFFSILASVGIAVILKRGEGASHDRLVVMGANYISASGLAVAIWVYQGALLPGLITLVLGVVGGFFYAVALFLWMRAIRVAGIATSTAALRMSVVWPVAMSIVLFSEYPTFNQSVGIVYALLAIVLITVSGRAVGESIFEGAAIRLLLVFVTGGGAFVTLKLFTEFAPAAEKEALLVIIYLSAVTMTWASVLAGSHQFSRPDFINGGLMGVLNVTSNSLVLLGLQSVPGVLAFPLMNTGVLLLTSFLGVTLWRERPGAFGYLAIGSAVVAAALLNSS